MTRPLAGHAFHLKSDAELRYILKDASEAALAMRDHNLFAEGKYLDQVNDAATVLAYRQRREEAAREEAAFADYDAEMTALGM